VENPSRQPGRADIFPFLRPEWSSDISPGQSETLPWVTVVKSSKSCEGRRNRRHDRMLCRPSPFPVRPTQGGASLCPGLICDGPSGHTKAAHAIGLAQPPLDFSETSASRRCPLAVLSRHHLRSALLTRKLTSFDGQSNKQVDQRTPPQPIARWYARNAVRTRGGGWRSVFGSATRHPSCTQSHPPIQLPTTSFHLMKITLSQK